MSRLPLFFIHADADAGSQDLFIAACDATDALSFWREWVAEYVDTTPAEDPVVFQVPTTVTREGPLAWHVPGGVERIDTAS